MNTKNKISVKESVVFNGPPDTYPIPAGGIGKAFFLKMIEYDKNIHQIDAITGETQTNGDVLAKSIRVAIEMRARGIRERDVLGLCLFNTMETVLPVMGSLFLGAIVFPLHPSLSEDDFRHMLSITRPKIIFTVAESREMIEKALCGVGHSSEIVSMDRFAPFVAPKRDEDVFEPVHVDDLDRTAFVMCSSGTTGAPKGVQISHVAACVVGDRFGLCGYDFGVTLMYSPLYWISAVLNLSMTIMNGATKIVADGFEEASCLEFIEKYKIELILLPTNQILRLIKHPTFGSRDVSSLDCVLVGGAPTTAEQFGECRRVFGRIPVLNIYGLTEFAGAVSMFPKSDSHLVEKKTNSTGRLWYGVSVKIVDPDTDECVGTDRRGEIRVKSETMTKGYYENPRETEESFDEDGFFKTGDIGYVDDDNCLFIVDRMKMLLKYRGWQITPGEIETVVAKHPEVGDVCVMGTIDEVDGDLPTAFVVKKTPDSNLTANEIIEFVTERVPDHKRLRGGVRFLDKLPKTPSDKIKRSVLKNLLNP